MEKKFIYPSDGPQADLTVEAYGLDLSEAFANIALGAFNAITLLEEVEPLESRIVEVRSEDYPALLYDFLDELLFIHDSELLVFSKIDVKIGENPLRLIAECRGERLDSNRHKSRIVIKAITFHQMKIEETPKGWRIRVVFDT
ncbi:archease [Candidatus Bathyarchaeota archaeon]|nr:archease [Candidatus Bathyarchaeota archaeon]